MQLTLDQIQSVTFGAAQLWQDETGIHFRRCTQNQIDFWYSLREGWGRNSTSTVGVCFDFHTDSNSLELTFCEGKKFDVYLDGILYWCHPATESVLSLTLPGGEHRVTVTFPSHSLTPLRSFCLDDNATLRPHVFDRKILFLGDSITQGWCSSRDSFSWAWNICFALNAQCVNQGVGGTGAQPGAFPSDLDFDPDTVIVAYGTNDWSLHPTLEALKETHDRYWELVREKYAGKQLVGISPTYRFNTEAGRKMGSFSDCCETVKQSIRDCGATLVDGFDLIPHQEMFFADGVHPLDIGYKTFSDHLLQYLI